MKLTRSTEYGWLLCFCAVILLFSAKAPAQQQKLKAYSASAMATDAAGNPLTPAQAAVNSALATFPYTVVSSRDGNTYSGFMVGQSPFGNGLTTTTINTPILPVIVVTDRIATKITNGSVLTTKPGITVFDPTAPDNACLTSPTNVPLTLMEQSPILQSATFTFGATTVGTTQYIDAFQRANFWEFVAGTDYHTILNPQILPPVTLNVSGHGLAIPAVVFGGCGPLAVVDLAYFFQHVFRGLLNAVGPNSAQFPVFLFYNTVMSASSPEDLKHCCILGFHAAVSKSAGSPVQTYSFIDFDTSGAFGPTIRDTSIAAHEVGEWMDDPFGNNPTPAWGHVGQVGGCQNNVEVGDPLTGTNIPTVTGTNGFTYHLQELAFFSWFYGAPSIAVNGWFSDNNTFTTDAGQVCMKH